jgi:hypothetical protein
LVLAAAFGRGGFNGLEADRCEAFAAAVPDGLLAFLADFLAAAARFFADGVRFDLAEAVLDLAEAVLRADVLGDFFRVSLDIRLPFVAFDGSTIRQWLAVFWQARIE